MVDLVLWAGTLGRASFEARLRATAAAGYAGMSVFPWDCRQPARASVGAHGIRRSSHLKG